MVEDKRVNVSVIGGSGYVGGELLRLLFTHPKAEVIRATSRTYSQEYVFGVHPNLRGVTQMKFTPYDFSQVSEDSDLIFTALPHGSSMKIIPELFDVGMKIIDLGADFRLKNPEDYQKWYGWDHIQPELLDKAVVGLPEIHRKEIKDARLVSCSGCMAVSSILGLSPLVKSGAIEENRIIVDVKIGSSGAGSNPTLATHHAERFGGVRPYKPTTHRHIAEIEQELNALSNNPVKISFSPHAVNMVRGILSTMHVFLKEELSRIEVWKMYRSHYYYEPFIRIIQYKKGLYRFPDPKVVVGSNFCDIGFKVDSHINRLVVFSAVDNLMKGAAGGGIQCLNIMTGFDERTGLELPGFHPM